MNRALLGHNPHHRAKNARMLLETVLILFLFFGLTWQGLALDSPLLIWFSILGQGVWLQRVYCVGHEASHQKLYPKSPRTNDLVGQLFLWLLLVPLPIFRQIHRFHHGSNRRDEQTSALDVYTVSKNAPWYKRAAPYLLWYAGIGLGGWFLHSLISILFFLFLPLKTARKVSPAFKGWTGRDQFRSILAFAIPVVGQVVFCRWVGLGPWLHLYALPLLVFAIVYSVQLYVYHYATTIGPKTLFHARRLTESRLISWWLLNLNEHDTHHRRPKAVWYSLPEAATPLPPEFAANQNVNTFTAGILQQFRGPTVIET